MNRPGVAGLLRLKAPELVIEALFVVFAVLVALAVDEWDENRELREKANRARAAVVSELVSNQEELAEGHRSTVDMLQRVTGVLDRFARGEAVQSADVSGELPDFSDAAWETARVTGAVARMDYDWVLEIARVYETQDLTWSVQRDLIMSLGVLFAQGPEEGRFRDLQGQLAVLVMLQEGLAGKYAAVLEGS